MTQQTDALEAALPNAKPAPSPWVAVRGLRPRNRARVREHLLALDDADRALRFGRVVGDEQIGAYVDHLDFDRDLLFGIFNRKLRLVALAHVAFAPTADGAEPVAEFGVSVLARWRGRGLGARLFDHAVMHARNRGARTLLLHIAAENAAMLAIVRRAGAAEVLDGRDVTAELPLADDTFASQFEALVGHRAAEIDYRFKRHALRLDKLRQAWLPSPFGSH